MELYGTFNLFWFLASYQHRFDITVSEKAPEILVDYELQGNNGHAFAMWPQTGDINRVVKPNVDK